MNLSYIVFIFPNFVLWILTWADQTWTNDSFINQTIISWNILISIQYSEAIIKRCFTVYYYYVERLLSESSKCLRYKYCVYRYVQDESVMREGSITIWPTAVALFSPVRQPWTEPCLLRSSHTFLVNVVEPKL